MKWVEDMYHKFNWTKIAQDRIGILKNYEPLQPYILMELARTLRSDMFLDIGANIGAYSILMSSLASVGTIHSFEPSPLTFDELERNIRINGLQNRIITHKQAVSDSVSVAHFGIISDYSGANSVIDTSIHSENMFASQVAVDCVPLDDALTSRSQRVCLKIDVEGHEIKVLRGARDFLTANQAIIQLENYSGDDMGIPNLLTEYGYRCVFHVGPDHYFTNASEKLEDNDIVHVFEKASSELIKSNLEVSALQSRIKRPVRINFPAGIALEVSGTIADFARETKKTLKKK